MKTTESSALKNRKPYLALDARVRAALRIFARAALFALARGVVVAVPLGAVHDLHHHHMPNEAILVAVALALDPVVVLVLVPAILKVSRGEVMSDLSEMHGVYFTMAQRPTMSVATVPPS